MTKSIDPALHTPLARQGNTAFAGSLALLLIRLVLGYVFFYHGSQKLFGWFTADGMPQVKMLAAGLTLPVLPPAVWAYMAAVGEFAGGTLVLLGLLARLATIPILVTMWVAIATVHGQFGFSGVHEQVTLASGKTAYLTSAGYEYNLALIAMAAAVLIAGPGLVSADAFLFRRGLWGHGPQPLTEPGKRGG